MLPRRVHAARIEPDRNQAVCALTGRPDLLQLQPGWMTRLMQLL